MAIATIEQIRSKREEIRQALKEVDRAQFDGQTFGGENEYQYASLLGGIESLLIDISTLTGAPKQFLKLSSHQERGSILSHLNSIHQYLEQPTNLVGCIDDLKAIVRSFNVRDKDDRYLEFESEIDKVIQLKGKLEQGMSDLKEMQDIATASGKELEELVEKAGKSKEDWDNVLEESRAAFDAKTEEGDEARTTLETRATELEGISDRLDVVETSATEKGSDISELLTEAKASVKVIETFTENVQDREGRLEKVDQKLNAHSTKLEEYEAKHLETLTEAEALIESARLALEYSTAEGISAAFQSERNKIEKSSGALWLVGAVFSMVIAITAAAWIVWDHDVGLAAIIGRLALIPLPVASAVFCASQYVKRGNLLTDYGYKTVLSKSIIGFSEELRSKGEGNRDHYEHYIKKVLEEIHQDPLRKRKGAREERSKEAPESVESILQILEKLEKVRALARGE